MTSRLPFYFVDVFATRPLTGNPLSLVPDADGLDEARMRAIAREFNQSETTFLLRPSLPGATVRLRSFTRPASRSAAPGTTRWVPGCGWRPQAGLPRTPACGRRSPASVLPVEVVRAAGQPAMVWMDQSPPRFGAVAGDRAGLAACLGLGERDLAPDEDARVASTGAAHLLVPARDRGAVDRAAPDPARLKSALRQAGAEGCYLYSRDPVDAAGAVAYARFFNPTVGIAEDPATGTAAGPLAARLVAEGRIPDESTVIIEQGYALGRPSRIAVSVSRQRVRVGGSGLVVAEGALIG